MLQSEEPFENMSKIDMLSELDHFQSLKCEKCGANGNWTVLNIFLEGNNDFRDRIFFRIRKENGEVLLNQNIGDFSSDLVYYSAGVAKQSIIKLKGNFTSKQNGYANLTVDFLKSFPYIKTSIIDFDGFSKRELINDLNNIFSLIDRISSSLKIKLEDTYIEFKNAPVNPRIYVVLKDEIESIRIYLIAKEPKEETYYGVKEIESEIIKEIVSISLNEIESMPIIIEYFDMEFRVDELFEEMEDFDM